MLLFVEVDLKVQSGFNQSNNKCVLQSIQVSLDLPVCVCHATENGSLRLFRQEKLPGKTCSVLKGLTLMHLSNTDKGNSNQYHKLNFCLQSIFWIVLCVLFS